MTELTSSSTLPISRSGKSSRGAPLRKAPPPLPNSSLSFTANGLVWLAQSESDGNCSDAVKLGAQERDRAGESRLDLPLIGAPLRRESHVRQACFDRTEGEARAAEPRRKSRRIRGGPLRAGERRVRVPALQATDSAGTSSGGTVPFPKQLRAECGEIGDAPEPAPGSARPPLDEEVVLEVAPRQSRHRHRAGQARRRRAPPTYAMTGTWPASRRSPLASARGV